MKYNEVFQLDHNSWFDFEEVYDLAVDHFPDGSRFVEIGSWQGASAAYLALKIRQLKKNIELHCIDLWTGDPNNENEQLIVKSLPPMKKIFIENMNKLGIYPLDLTEPQDIYVIRTLKENYRIHKPYTFMLESDSSQAMKKYSPNTIDFIFIDGGHGHDQVRKDIQNAKRVIKDDGWIGGHDYPSVKSVVHQEFSNVELIKTSRPNDNTMASWLVRNL